MLLALDVGNSNTVLGLFRPATDGAPAQLVADWRITTPYKQTADELGVLFQTLFSMRGMRLEDVTGIAISSVVPPLDATMRRVTEIFFPCVACAWKTLPASRSLRSCHRSMPPCAV